MGSRLVWGCTLLIYIGTDAVNGRALRKQGAVNIGLFLPVYDEAKRESYVLPLCLRMFVHVFQ